MKTVAKNGPNYGRMYYACAMGERCSFFMFVEPELHYMDRQLKAPTRVIESIKMEAAGSDGGGDEKAE